ncbi:MAG: hypothetical protein SFV21_19515 [Rhodospirillaceae bacterium]|nr:hypothetical protein [Rhodospirillaceae bacterium]
MASAAPTSSERLGIGFAVASLPAETTPTDAVAETLRTAIELRKAAQGLDTPLNRSERIEPVAVSRRIQAHQSVIDFAAAIGQGMSAAATAEQRAELADRLATVVDAARQEAAGDLTDLITDRTALPDGWFLTARYGADAELAAARLLARAIIDAAMLSTLAERVEGLAERGDASAEAAAILRDASRPAQGSARRAAVRF